MTIPLSPEVEQALANLRTVIENQLNAQSAPVGNVGESAPAMFKTNDEMAFASQETIPNQVEAEVVLPVLNQTSMINENTAAPELPYPDVPDLSTPTATEQVLPQPDFPIIEQQNAKTNPVSNDNPFLVSEYQEPPAPGNNLPVETSLPEEIVANPNFNTGVPLVEEVIATAPSPAQGSFTKARNLLSNVLQRGGQTS